MINTQQQILAVGDRHEDAPVADLRDANLAGASLRRANLAGAILDGANLRESDLQGANLRQARLYSASLNSADLRRANLGMSDLRFACLEGANLAHVNLHRANLLGARLADADVVDADFAGAILPDGALFRDDACLERFTDTQNPAFAATLGAIEATDHEAILAAGREGAAGDHEMSWAQFVERTYGSLADDPIEWHPPEYAENQDRRE